MPLPCAWEAASVAARYLSPRVECENCFRAFNPMACRGHSGGAISVLEFACMNFRQYDHVGLGAMPLS
jgi:hypothetical protein